MLFGLRALRVHSGDPFAVGTLHFHFEGIRGRRNLFEGDAHFHLLAAHHAFVVVRPGIARDRSLRDTGHRHPGIVDRVVRVGLLVGTVAHERELLAGTHRRLALTTADDREL